MTKKAIYTIFCSLIILFSALSVSAQTYQRIIGWSDSVNLRIERFFEETLSVPGRKVAVFDCDGTLIGQVPFYFVDEVVCDFANKYYKDVDTKDAKMRMRILNDQVANRKVRASNPAYRQDRVKFFAGLSSEQVNDFASSIYTKKYLGKAYSQMRQLINNMYMYGFEVWIITGSPEIVYEETIYELFGIPAQRVLGSKTLRSQGIITDKVVPPLPYRLGKADAIETQIKVKPLFVAGNSRGDLEMMLTSIGMKMIVNPNDREVLSDDHIKGQTLKQFWKDQGALIVTCEDEVPKGIKFSSSEYDIPVNKKNK
ncbi:MAG: HAD family hydrolase [Hyphomicrobiales bacterium]